MRQIVARDIHGEPDLAEAVLIACDGHRQFADLILHGENYIGKSLAEAARESFTLNCPPEVAVGSSSANTPALPPHPGP